MANEKKQEKLGKLVFGRLHDAGIDRVQHHFRDGIDVELFHDVFPVGVYGMSTEIELSRDFLGDFARGYQSYDFAFPGREQARGAIFFLRKGFFQDEIEDFAAKELFSLIGCSNSA